MREEMMDMGHECEDFSEEVTPDGTHVWTCVDCGWKTRSTDAESEDYMTRGMEIFHKVRDRMRREQEDSLIHHAFTGD